MPTVKLLTLGCKVNQYETQAIREQFVNAGFRELFGRAPADFYIINTCTVTQKADRESLYLIRRCNHENPKGKIIVTGCLTELDSGLILHNRGVAHIQKNSRKELMVNDVLEKFSLPQKNKKRHPNGRVKGAISYFEGRTRAFLKIQDGCNNRCAYCKVPLVRGRSRSKPFKDIIEEAKRVVHNGFKEIVLTGICLGSYGKDLSPVINLVKVIKEMEKIDGLYRIRLSSIEAGDIDNRLINCMKNSKKLCHHLHIPFQHGDDRILQLMKRPYSHEDYISLAAKLKKSIPDISITTDIIVGFPREDEKAFGNTIRLIKEVLPLKVHIFPYSCRNNTAASGMPAQVAAEVISERKNRLARVCETVSTRFKKQFIGKKLEVLIEARDKKKQGFWFGYSGNYMKIWLRSKTNPQNSLISLALKTIEENSA